MSDASRQWDFEAHTAKARGRSRPDISDRESKPRVKRPVRAQQRHDDLDLGKNLGTTTLVDNVVGSGGGSNGPGFYCDACRRMFKDSAAYLDHINGRSHLHKIGQATTVGRSSLKQVRARIAAVIEERKLGKTADQRYDFERRLKEIADEQRREKEMRRSEQDKRRKARAEAAAAPREMTQDDMAMMAAMGFAGFGSTKK
ncbi:U4/U6.U5 snRNP associated protein [Malassezia cuniculi]|uniref:U4/U6.U5 snRNP associated protein n=1 Tax=Malassezia cuniculi TaxID=948313 RepID=A0AAF0EXR3_9BASI|nr:U4/U6.U5 snRNP associated protein [Malassezia cuniculi]